MIHCYLFTRHCKTYTGGTKPVERVYLKPGEPIGIKCRVGSKKKINKTCT